MLDSQTGMINQIFKAVGLPGQAWLSRQGSAMGVIVFVTLWWTAGYNIILFLSSLQDLPQDLYEAAAVDGASGWAQFWHITLPLLRNRMLFITTLQIIASFKLFDQVYILTGGDRREARALWPLPLRNGFSRFHVWTGCSGQLVHVYHDRHFWSAPGETVNSLAGRGV